MVDSLGKEVLPNHCQLIMVAERKRVDRLIPKKPAHPKVSPFRPTIEKGGRTGIHQKINFLTYLGNSVCQNRLTM